MRSLFDELEPREVRVRAWYRIDGEEVEVLGATPMMVWFRRAGESNLAQRTIPIVDFLRRAMFVREPMS